MDFRGIKKRGVEADRKVKKSYYLPPLFFCYPTILSIFLASAFLKLFSRYQLGIDWPKMKFSGFIPSSFSEILMFLYSLIYVWSSSRIKFPSSIFESLSNTIVSLLNFLKNVVYLISSFLRILLHETFGLSLNNLFTS